MNDSTVLCRRFFLQSLGGLVAVSALPSLADDPSSFPARGKWERLALAYQHVKAGATRPFSLLHISDTHLTAAYPHEAEVKQTLMARRTQTFGGRQEEALRDSLAWAKENVDFVLHTGDIIDWQSEANFDLVRKYFGADMFGTLGNHEFSRNMWLEKSKQTNEYKSLSVDVLRKIYPFDLRLASRVVNGVNFVSMDDVYGYVDRDQTALFRAEVQKGLPIILCLHVPLYTPAIWRASCKFWRRAGKKHVSDAIPNVAGDYARQTADSVTREFIAYLKTEPLLKCVLAGHLHITVQDRFSPTAMEYVIGGNFLFHGQEILVS